MPDSADPAAAPVERQEALSIRSRGGLLNVVALVLALGLQLLITPTTQPWSPDDGSYAHAVHLVDDGRWYDERPELDLVDDPLRYPISASEVDQMGRAYPYLKHPAWIVSLHRARSVLGDTAGSVALNGLGLVVAACSAWVVAVALGSRRPQLAFWVVGSGPLLVTWLGLWAHGASAGVGGLAAVAVVRLITRRSLGTAVLLGLALGASVLLRTEAVFLVIGAGAAVVLCRDRAVKGRFLDAGVATGIAAATFLAERQWISSIAPDPMITSQAVSQQSWLQTRLYASWRGLASGAQAHPGGEMLTVVAMAAVAYGLYALTKGRNGPGAVGVAVGAAVALFRAVTWPESYLGGLFAAWPVLLVGLGLWVLNARRATRPEWALALMALTVTAGIGVTQYDGGAGLEWGGRYLMAVAVPLAVLAARGLETSVGDGPSRDRNGVIGRVTLAVIVTGAVLAMVGMVATSQRRHDAQQVVNLGREASADVVIPGYEHLPRFDLSADARLRWRGRGSGSVAAAVADAFSRGDQRVAVVGLGAPALEVPEAAGREVIRPDLVIFIAP